MKKIVQKKEAGGKLVVTQDFTKNLFLAKPRGIINPPLVQMDLKEAKEFAHRCKGPWTYVTNTEGVRLVNPLNILFLKEIKKINKLKQIVIYAPGFFNRVLLRLVSFIVQPDRIIKKRSEFDNFLEQVH